MHLVHSLPYASWIAALLVRGREERARPAWALVMHFTAGTTNTIPYQVARIDAPFFPQTSASLHTCPMAARVGNETRPRPAARIPTDYATDRVFFLEYAARRKLPLGQALRVCLHYTLNLHCVRHHRPVFAAWTFVLTFLMQQGGRACLVEREIQARRSEDRFKKNEKN